MEYADLPQDMEQELLYNMESEELVFHCLVHKRTFKACNSPSFWINYTKGMNELKMFKLLNQVVLKSQYLGRSLYSVIISKTNIPFNDVSLFLLMSIMRNDTETLNLLRTHEREGKIKSFHSYIFNNDSSIFNYMNEVINRINDNNQSLVIESILEINSYIPYNIIRLVLRDRIGNENISNLYRKMDTYPRKITSSFAKFYLAVVADANNINTIITYLAGISDNQWYVPRFLDTMANYLPVDLYPQAEVILRENRKLLRSMSLAHFIGSAEQLEDIDHLQEQLRFQYDSPELIIDDVFCVNSILPKNFIELVNKLPMTSNIIVKVRDIAILRDSIGEWANEVLRLYEAQNSK